MFPIIHLPTFRATVDDIYQGKSRYASPSWLSMFFAVLAAGSLFTLEPPSPASYSRPAEFLSSAQKIVDPWNNNHTFNDVRTLFLITLCLNEMNLKSAAWNWLGNVVRVGQELGLYTEPDSWPVIEGEMRRRTWWATYVLDRTMATEMGHPFLIEDSDCDVRLPAAVDDHYIREDGMHVPNGAEPLTHSLLAIIHVVRSYTGVIKALQYPSVPPAHLSAFDGHLRKCLNTFPPACDPANTVALAPHFLPPLAYLLHVRMMLHRHNLTPTCNPETRFQAVESCTHIAMETASLITRTSSPAEGTTSLLSTHLFRSTLFLLLTGSFDQAITCVRALASMDGKRDIVPACGRYLAFFVTTLAAKRTEHSRLLMHAGTNSRVDNSALLFALARDEELIAYVSADMQASPSRNWVWAESERESVQGATGTSSKAASSISDAIFRADQRTGLSETELKEWGGWNRLESSIRALVSSASSPWAALPPPPSLKSESPAFAGIDRPRLTDSPRYASEPSKLGPDTSPNSHANLRRGSDRLSIANII